MTKIILLCLAAATLLAFVGAENEQGDSSLVESSNLRAVRAAGPVPGKCNGDKNCQRTKKRNKKKGKKNNQRARNNKKSRKSDTKSRKSDKKSRKSKKKSKKNSKRNKNNNNKKRKNRRGQRLNRQNARDKTTGVCTPDTCVSTGISYMKKNDMVRNFEAQKKRLERFVKQANSKANKSADFAPLITKLTALGGGNSSNLTCNGNGTNTGAVLLKNLTAELGKCNASITKECKTNSVVQAAVLNETTTASLNACLSTMKAFKMKMAEAGNKALTEVAVCTKFSAMKVLADNVNKTCMPTTLLSKAASANTKCKAAHKACKGRMEDVTTVQSLCSPKHG